MPDAIMINLTPNLQPKSKKPLYRQLYNYIKSEIVEGRLKSKEKLPSSRGLATHLGISRNTVENAYGQLEAEGYIKGVAKSGYFVSKIEGSFFYNKDIKLPLSKPLASPHYKYDFSTNNVDIASFPFSVWAKLSREIMHDENRQLLKASHPQGEYELREAIAVYLYNSRGVNCSPEQIVVGAGTEYLIGLLIQILGSSAAYAIENPGYSKLNSILESYGRHTSYIDLDNQGISVEKLKESNANIVYVTPSHHFPLGIIMPISRRLELLAWASESGNNYIIEDDYDSEFRFSGRPIPSLQGLGTGEKVVYISTFSKTIAPSIRASFMVLPQTLLEVYKQHFMFYSSTISRFEQYTLCKFIKNGYFERHLNKMRNIYKGRKEHLTEVIKASPFADRIEIIGADAGLHLLLKVQGISEEQLVAKATNISISVAGLSEYYFTNCGHIPESTIILGYAHLTASDIKAALALLLQAWLGNH